MSNSHPVIQQLDFFVTPYTHTAIDLCREVEDQLTLPGIYLTNKPMIFIYFDAGVYAFNAFIRNSAEVLTLSPIAFGHVSSTKSVILAYDSGLVQHVLLHLDLGVLDYSCALSTGVVMANSMI